MFQLFDVLLGRGIVLPSGCQLHEAADFRNAIESVPAAIAAHAMTQHMDGSKVLVGQRMAKSLDISSAVCKKAGHDVFKISVNLHRDVIGRLWMWRLQGQAARF